MVSNGDVISSWKPGQNAAIITSSAVLQSKGQTLKLLHPLIVAH